MSDLKKAVGKRILDLCNEKSIKLNTLATQAGVNPSTIYAILDPNKKTVGLKTVKIICDGFGVSLGEFFSTKEFDDLEQEIK